MRRELREKVGPALGVPTKDWDALDCIESRDVMVVFMPGSALGRDDFADHKPLMRQALVAACAATETYLADKVMEAVRKTTSSREAASARLRKMPMSVGEWLYIEQQYKYRRRGLHERILEPHVREMANTAPSQVGVLMSLIGVDKWSATVDHHRGVAKGDSEALLTRITERRNKIVHTGDRHGRGRAKLTIAEVKEDLVGLESVVQAIEKMVT